jgi:hypothetical protein
VKEGSCLLMPCDAQCHPQLALAAVLHAATMHGASSGAVLSRFITSQKPIAQQQVQGQHSQFRSVTAAATLKLAPFDTVSVAFGSSRDAECNRGKVTYYGMWFHHPQTITMTFASDSV